MTPTSSAPPASTPPGTFTLCSETRQRVDQVRAQAAGRPYRSDVLLQAVVIGQDPDKTASQWVTEEPDLTAGQVLDSPFVLLAEDAAHAAAILRHRQDQYGFDSVTTYQPSLDPRPGDRGLPSHQHLTRATTRSRRSDHCPPKGLVMNCF